MRVYPKAFSRMVKKAVQRGRSERGPEAYFFRYVEGPSDTRTKLAGFFTILLGDTIRSRFAVQHRQHILHAHEPHSDARLHGG